MDIDSPESSNTAENLKITFEEAYHIFTSTKKSKTSSPDEGGFKRRVEETLSATFPDEKHNEVFRTLTKRHVDLKKLSQNDKVKKLKTDFWQRIAYSTISSSAQMLNQNLPISPQKAHSKDRTNIYYEINSDEDLDNSILDVTPPERRRRVDKLYNSLLDTAKKEDITPTQLAALLLSRASYTKHKEISSWAEDIAHNRPMTANKLPIEHAAYIYTFCEFGRRKWTALKSFLKTCGHDILPTHSLISEHIKSITPRAEQLPEPYHGVRYSLPHAIDITFKRQLQVIDLSGLQDSTFDFVFKMAVDGSGDHKIFNQRNQVETSNITMGMICPLKLSSPSNPDFWQQPNPSSSGTHRPLYLQLGKESIESNKYFGPITKECKNLEIQNPAEVTIDGKKYSVNFKIRISGLDRKFADSVTGLGGAYCDICTFSEKDCHDTNKVNELHIGGRTISDTAEIVNQLTVNGDGELVKSKGDYDKRKGVVRSPTIEKDIESCQPLHLLLRTTDFAKKLVIHEKAGIIHWSESVEYADSGFVKDALSDIQLHMKRETGLKIDYADTGGHGGTTTTGNTARKLMYDEKCSSEFLSLVPEHRRENLKKLWRYLAIILRVISCNTKVKNLDKFESLCRETYKFILDNWPPVKIGKKVVPQVVISPSVHKLLAHSGELMRLNDSFGLGLLSEAGVESSNKLLRRFRINLSRKTSQTENLEDCAKRLWMNGDPIIESIRKLTRANCKNCGDHIGHSTRFCPKDLMTVNDLDKAVNTFLCS